MESRREESRDGSSREQEASETIWHKSTSMTGHDGATCDLEGGLTCISWSTLQVSLGNVIDRGWKPPGESDYFNYELG